MAQLSGERIHFYCQILFWLEAQLNEKRKERLLEQKASRPLFVGLNAPQGAGKTTLTKWLVDQLEEKQIQALAISIDDFYLTCEQQVQLAQANSDNPYLQQRGYPGTHDIELGVKTLQQLRKNQSEVAIPRYVKSAHQGKGDRSPENFWPVVTAPFDLVLIEGWCLGFSPLANAEGVSAPMRKINELLNEYSLWHEFLDAKIVLSPKHPEYVIDWRIEAERNMRASGQGGMSDEDIRAYVQTFLPAYELYAQALRENPLGFARFMWMEIGRGRLPG